MEGLKVLYKRYISTRLVGVLKKSGITANQVTIGNHIMTLTLVVWGYSRGTWIGGLFATVIMGLNVILDYADGELARENKTIGPVGEWIDSVFDVIIQNAVMAAIAIGCFKNGLPLVAVVWFFIGNAGSNLVSFHYNNTFGFNSHDGNVVFRRYMRDRPNWFNRIISNIIDPTASAVGLFFYTARYWVLIGAIFNVMPYMFLAITIIANVRWFIMYILYGMFLQGRTDLHILIVLEKLGEENAI